MIRNNNHNNTELSTTFLVVIVLIVSLINVSQSTIWDNILSQTQSSHPINLTQSFNIDFQLPKQYDLDGNFDFNSQLKVLTLKLSKNIIIQKLDVIKAQLDMQQLVLNVDQFLLGCEKFVISQDLVDSDKLKQRVNKVNSYGVSKRSLFMVNLLFKYIGRYQIKTLDNNKKHNDKNSPGDILDIFKNNNIFDELQQVFGGNNGGKDKPNNNQNKKALTQQELKKHITYYDMFQFSITDLLPKHPEDIISKSIAQINSKPSKDEKLDLSQQQQQQNQLIQNINSLQSLNLDILKFVILTNPLTGQIVKVYKNKQLKQQMQFKLQSSQTIKYKCNKEAKKLTLDDLTNGAKYLYQNKDTLGNVLN